MRSSNCGENSNGRRNSRKRKKHLKRDNDYNWLNTGDISEICSGFSLLWTGDVVEVNLYGQKQALKSELRRGPLRWSMRGDRVKELKGIVHREVV